jgi:hypothetical protein
VTNQNWNEGDCIWAGVSTKPNKPLLVFYGVVILVAVDPTPARMVEQNLANELSQRAAEALGHLVRIMDDPTAKARDRLAAAQILKVYLLKLERLLESQQTAPEIRKEITASLRKYWRS